MNGKALAHVEGQQLQSGFAPGLAQLHPKIGKILMITFISNLIQKILMPNVGLSKLKTWVQSM